MTKRSYFLMECQPRAEEKNCSKETQYYESFWLNLTERRLNSQAGCDFKTFSGVQKLLTRKEERAASVSRIVISGGKRFLQSKV